MSLLSITCAAINAFFLYFCDNAMHLFAMLAFAWLVYDVFIQCLCVYVVLLYCCIVVMWRKRKTQKQIRQLWWQWRKEKRKYQTNTPAVVTVKREKRDKTKKIITSLSCTRVRLPPEVNDTKAGAKWANHLVAPQDNELISNQAINLSNPINTHTHACTHTRTHARTQFAGRQACAGNRTRMALNCFFDRLAHAYISSVERGKRADPKNAVS